MRRVYLLMFILIWPTFSYSLSFELPKPGNSLVGKVQFTQVSQDEDFSDVALRFDVGYYEIFEANPEIDPDTPSYNTVLMVPTQYILPTELQRNRIVINLAEMRLYYQPKFGNKIYIFPIGIGKEGWETPTGEMSIIGKVENPPWVVPESIYKVREAIGSKVRRIVPPGPDNPLGKYVMRLSKAGYLIHGTNLFAGVGRRTSAGCIRLYEKDIEELYGLVEIGTKVIIINQPYKAGWSKQELYLEAHMPLFEQRMTVGDDSKAVLAMLSTLVKNKPGVRVDWSRVDRVVKEHLVIPRVVSGVLVSK